MNLLQGPVTTIIRRKVQEVVNFLNTYSPVGDSSGATARAVTTTVVAASLVKALDVTLTPGVLSAINMLECARFTLTSNVKMGVYANAINGKLDLSATGFVVGLAGAVCAELDMPSTNPTGGAGTYTVFEGELGVPHAYTSTVPISFINLNVWGIGGANGVGVYEHNGFLFDITGFTVDNAHIVHTNTHVPTHGLRCRVGGTTMDLLFSTAVTP